jgi:hypothetical protein
MSSIAHCVTWMAPLLAQGPLEPLGRSLGEGRDTGDPATFALLVAILLALLLALVAARRIAARHAPGYHNPAALFRELSRLHELDWAARRLLKRIARQQGLDSPARLFVEPDRLSGERLQGPLAAFREPAAALARVLFAQPQTDEGDGGALSG